MKLITYNCGKSTRTNNCLVYGKSAGSKNLFFNYWVKRNEVDTFADERTIAIFKLKKLKK